MSDNVPITAGSGTTIATDNVGGVQYQRVKIGLGADGVAVDAVGGSGVDSTGVQRVTLATNVGLPAGTNNIGDVDVLTVPADPFGANADAAVAAGATGSIQAKLRRLTADIDAIKTSVAGATPAGTNAIGKLAANSGVDIGDVDVTSLPALAAGTNVIGQVRGMGGWTKNHAPAAATQATITQAAGGGSVKNVCTSIAISLASAAAPTVGVVTFNLRDGATGVGTILWTLRLSLPATSGSSISESLPVWIEGSANTAMTLETSGAPAANVQATVAMTGTTI